MKKTISLILCFAMLLSTLAFAMPAFAAELDFEVEAAEDYAQETDASAEASLAGTLGNEEGKPGINLLTGTTEVYDFEDTAYTFETLIDRDEGLVADPHDGANRVMWVGPEQYSNIGLTPLAVSEYGGGYVSAALAPRATFENERQLTISFKLKGNGPELIFYSGIGNASPGWKVLTTFAPDSETEWKEIKHTFTYSQAISSLGKMIFCLANCKETKGGFNYYIDDLSIVPSYRVRYYGPDGKTVNKTAYVDGNAETYAIAEDALALYENNDKFVGFKFMGDDDSAVIEGDIDLTHRDIDLVAVVDCDIICAESYIPAAEGSQTELTAKYDAIWSVDDETMASIEGDGDTAVLTAKGYAGVIGVNVVSVDDPTQKDTLYLKMRGPSKAKPGLNMITGDTNAFGFEDPQAESLYSVAKPGYTDFAANPLSSALNSSKTVMKLYHPGEAVTSGHVYPKLVFNYYDRYDLAEGERPVLVSFDWMGSYENVWLLGSSGNSTLTSPIASSNNNSKTAETWVHVDYAWTQKSKNKFDFQAGMNSALAGTPFYVDNLSIVPYYKVNFADATGTVQSYEFVSPLEDTYEIPESKLEGLDETKYEGYKIAGTDTLVSSVSLTDSDITLVPATKEGVEVIAPVSVAGYNGVTEGIDPKYPGVYYVFDEPLDVDTITLDELKNVWADSYIYDEENNTLIVFSRTKNVVGHSEYFQGYDSYIKTESGKYVVFPKSATLEYGDRVTNDGLNMIPYGNFETAYNPFTTDETTVDISVENGKLYATANTDSASFPHVYFTTVLEAGATYKLYAETKSLEVEAQPAVNVIFAGDSEGGLVNHSAVDTYHVFATNDDITGSGTEGYSYATEFTVTALDNDAEYATAKAAIYSSPVDNATVGFTIDNYELYRRTELKYVPNDAVISEGVEAPVAGEYLYTEGGVKNEEAYVTVADYFYEPVDDKRYVAGWISVTDGITYAAGDQINLAEVELDENGNYTLAPVVVAKEGYEFVNITFEETDLVTGTPDDINGIYMTEDALPMAQFYENVNIASEYAAQNKRFLGWSVDGTKAGMIQPDATIILEGDMHFTPIIGYDFNFAIESNRAGWSYNVGTVTAEDGFIKAKHKIGVGNDAHFQNSNVNIPGSEIYKIVVWVDDDYVIYNDTNHTTANDTKWTSGQTWEGLFFSHTGQGDHGDRRVAMAAYEKVTDAEGNVYYGFVANTTQNGSFLRDDVLKRMRLDPNNIFADINYRYIQIIDFPEYENEVINVTDLDVPVVGIEPDYTATIDGIAKINSIEWSPALSLGGLYKETTEYSATLKIAPVDSVYRFKDDVTVMVGDIEAEITEVDPTTGTLTAVATFPATENYKLFDFDLSLVPEQIVVEDTEDILLEINITEQEEDVVTDVTWTIEEGNEFAAITPAGLLSIYNEGTITVQAVSNYNENRVYKDINIVLTDAVTPVVITFSDENVANAPEAITRLAGDILDLGDFLDVKSSVAGMNFNGWTLDGETMLTDEITVPEEDITLYAVVNYDINMAVPNNVKGWTYTGAVSQMDDMLVAAHTMNPEHNDPILQKLNSFAVPASEFGKVQYYLYKDYMVGSNVETLEIGDWVQGTYFIRNGDGGASGDRYAEGYIVDIVGDYAVAECNLSANANWNGTLSGLRFDFNNGMYTFAIRYIKFVERNELADTSLDITNVVAPVLGYTPATTASADLIEVESVEWSGDKFMEYNYDGTDYKKFDAATEYTVTINGRIPLGENLKFSDDIVATVNGEDATLTENADGTVTVTYTFPATDDYADFTMEITGAEEIAKEGRTTQYRLVIDGDIPVKTATWSLEEGYESYARINETNGKLTPVRNIDELTIYATSHYNPDVKASFTVKLTNQAADAVVNYDANTTATVSNMPDPTTGAGRIKLVTEGPTRDGFIFAGWSEAPDSNAVVEYATTEGEDVTVYAVWEKVVAAYEFNDGTTNNSVGAGSMKRAQTSGPSEVKNGYWEISTDGTGNGDLRLYGNFTAVPSALATKFVVRLSTQEGGGDNVELYTHSLTGSNYLGASFQPAGLDNYRIHEFNLADNRLYLENENFSQFWFDPHNGLNETSRIDYIRILSTGRTVTFNANAGNDTVEGMPANGAIEAYKTLTVAEKPTRAGYEFIGWSLDALATTADDKIVVIDDVTVYAIWLKTVAIVDPTLVDLGVPTEEAVVITTEPVTEVRVIVTTPESEVILTTISDENGLAVIDLTQVEGEVTNATASAASDIEKVVLTDNETAADIVESAGSEEEVETNVTILINGVNKDGENGDDPYKYDTTVETVKPTGGSYKPTGSIPTINNAGEDGEDGAAAVDVKALMASAGEILLNFDSKSEADFFPAASLRQFNLNGVSDSVISFTNKGFASGSKDSPALFTSAFELDAATHPYIVMKLRNSTDSSCRIYFRTSEAGFAEARALTVAHGVDYTMAVYDMSTIADWKGTITGMFFSMGANAGDILEIDWIMFTDKVPENMEAIEGTKETFPVVNKDAMPFEDVEAADWFYSEVANAYRYGFVEGQSATVYNPEGQVTLAEVITLAVRLNYTYNGKELPAVAEGAEWYSNYVDAAVRAGIIKNTQFADYNAAALRKEVAQIMYKALPSDYIESINMFTSIPDVPTKDPAYGAIRKLYNAGVLMGMDGAYNFYPSNSVTRAEIAAVVNRMAIPANRKRVITEAELESRRQYYYADDLEAASLGNCYETKPTIKGDFAYATGKTGDPILYLTNVVGQLNGKEITKITVALKWDETKINANPVIFFTTPSGGWAAGRMISSKKGEKLESGSTLFTFDPSTNGQFADTITGIRFDPFDAKDIEFAVEYIIIE